ncbi:MAG: hypothetical protein EXQ89_05090 [Rhodospirillaceae bacterium]|nr:hypothetical protein [Rhodospirillaceae bacterium]
MSIQASDDHSENRRGQAHANSSLVSAVAGWVGAGGYLGADGPSSTFGSLIVTLETSPEAAMVNRATVISSARRLNTTVE